MGKKSKTNSQRNFIKQGGGGGSKAVYKLYKKQEKWYVVPSLKKDRGLLTVSLHRLLYLSARSISQAADTKFYLEQLKQDGLCLPPGPLFLNPKSLLQVFVFVPPSFSLPQVSTCCRQAGWR